MLNAATCSEGSVSYLQSGGHIIAGLLVAIVGLYTQALQEGSCVQ